MSDASHFAGSNFDARMLGLGTLGWESSYLKIGHYSSLITLQNLDPFINFFSSQNWKGSVGGVFFSPDASLFAGSNFDARMSMG